MQTRNLRGLLPTIWRGASSRTSCKNINALININIKDIIMEDCDLDKNGNIDYNEFLAFSLNRSKLLSKNNLEVAFKTFDKVILERYITFYLFIN